MALRTSTEKHGDRTVYLLHDDDSGASAAVLPSYGFNLFDLRLPAAGQVRRVVAAEDGWADHPRSAGRNGTPILFPFPNRIRNGSYSFQGKTYRLPANNGPNAIHGFAIDAPWDVVEHKADGSSAWITGRYQISKQSPDRLAQWPADAILQVRYTLAGRRVMMETTVTNPSAGDLPFGFGIHPYYYVPIDRQADPNNTAVIIPASESWMLDQFLPTGERKPVEPRLDFRKGQPITHLKLDDVLTGLDFEGDRCICRLVDRNLSAEFRLSFDRSFREIVLYTPPNEKGVIAVEPYTQTTDAINLQARGVDAGLRVLKHDEQLTMIIVMETVG